MTEPPPLPVGGVALRGHQSLQDALGVLARGGAEAGALQLDASPPRPAGGRAAAAPAVLPPPAS